MSAVMIHYVRQRAFEITMAALLIIAPSACNETPF